MVDKAHRLTDESWKKLKSVYLPFIFRAGKEIQKTVDEYFSKFAKQNESKRKLLE